MNDRHLPGEPQRLRDEPADHVRYVHSLPLDAFRIIHGNDRSWSRDLVWAFTIALVVASRNRRLRAGSKGLMQDAARLVIRHFEPAVRRLYRDRQVFVLLTDEARDELAIALAGEMRGNADLKECVRSFLENLCDDIAKLNEDVVVISAIDRQYPVNRIFNRWLDELEYLREKGIYRPFIGLHKAITDCSRIWNAVFGT